MASQIGKAIAKILANFSLVVTVAWFYLLEKIGEEEETQTRLY